MPLVYDPAKWAGGRIYQGDFLAGLVETRAQAAYVADAGAEWSIHRVDHPLALVLTPDCDLEQDANLRSSGQAKFGDPQSVGGVSLCDVFSASELGDRFRSDTWKRARQNQDERYHCFAATPLDSNESAGIEIIDFKRVFMAPPDAIYAAIAAGAVRRIAQIQGPHLYDLLHRYTAFQSRIGVEEAFPPREFER